MADYLIQYIQHSATGLPEDDTVNTLHFSTVEAVVSGSIALSLAGHVAAAHFNAEDPNFPGDFMEEQMSNSISRADPPTIKVYDANNPGSPVATTEQLSFRPPATGNDMPDEVAICLSFRGEYGTLLEEEGAIRPRARVRGRMFLGPWIAEVGLQTPVRPQVAVRRMILDYASKLADVTALPELVTVDAAWMVRSRTADASFPVVRAWVDDAFDIQRRRGVAPTTRLEVAL